MTDEKPTGMNRRAALGCIAGWAGAAVIWNVVGGILWTQLIVLLGRALGPKVHIDKYVLPIVAVIIVLSVIGVLFEARKGGKRLKAADAAASESAHESAPSEERA